MINNRTVSPDWDLDTACLPPSIRAARSLTQEQVDERTHERDRDRASAADQFEARSHLTHSGPAAH